MTPDSSFSLSIVPNAQPKSQAILGVNVAPIVPRMPETLTINLSSTQGSLWVRRIILSARPMGNQFMDLLPNAAWPL